MKFARTITNYLSLALSRLTLLNVVVEADPSVIDFKSPVHQRSPYAQHRIKRLIQRYCKNLVIKLVFAPYKIKNLFSVKDAISNLSRSRVVYKFSCTGCSTCYVGETNRHLATPVREHLASDKNSNIFQHIYGSETCRDLCSENFFSLNDTASTPFQLTIKEAFHIGWENPSLNKQVNHVNLTLSF